MDAGRERVRGDQLQHCGRHWGWQRPTADEWPDCATGRQSMVISNSLAFKNNIVLRDDAVLIIRNATFSHLSDFSGQYGLEA